MTPVEAEIVKLGLNGYLTTKISYANFLGDLAAALGGSADVVCDAVAADDRVGGAFFRPGAPFGGPCFPRDNPALIEACRRAGVDAALPEATDAVNARRLDAIETRLAAHEGVIGVCGLAFKPGTAVIDGSVGLQLARRLAAKGRRVVGYDPDPLDADPGIDVVSTVEELVGVSDVLLLTHDAAVPASVPRVEVWKC